MVINFDSFDVDAFTCFRTAFEGLFAALLDVVKETLAALPYNQEIDLGVLFRSFVRPEVTSDELEEDVEVVIGHLIDAVIEDSEADAAAAAVSEGGDAKKILDVD